MSDISASVARGRLQTIFARERNSACESDRVDSSQEILSMPSKHVPVPPDEVQVKPSEPDNIPVLEIELEIRTPECLKASQNEAQHSSLPLSPGEEAAKTVSPTNAAPADTATARTSDLRGLSAAVAFIAAAGVAWWANSKSESNVGPSEPTSAQIEKISPMPLNEIAQTGTSEILVSQPPSTPTQAISSMPAPESMAQEVQGKVATSPQAAARTNGVTQVKLQNGNEVTIPSSGVETKLAEFLKQALNKSGEFDLDRISFGHANAILNSSSSEQLQNVAKILMAYPKTRISINAYGDAITSRVSGLRLSRERADSVIRELARTGYKSRITARVYRGQRGKGSNGSEESQGRDERISLTVTNK